MLNGKYMHNIRILALVLCAQLLWVPAYADTTPPRIIHDIVGAEVPASRPYQFTATVSDNEAVAEVLLNYKHQDSSEFRSVPMKAQGGGTEYTVTLPAADLVTPGLDYYISATDVSGNQQVRGFDFDPLQLTLFTPVAVQTSSESESGSIGNRKIWYVVGAVALVGLVAGASGGGSGTTGQSDTTTFVLEQ